MGNEAIGLQAYNVQVHNQEEPGTGETERSFRGAEITE
jgi:hypothetical protein